MELSEKQFRTNVSGMIAVAGNIHWQISQSPIFGKNDEEGLYISFPLFSETKKRYALKSIRETLETNGIQWLREESGRWIIDLDFLFSYFPQLKRHSWLVGRVEPTVEFDVREREIFGKTRKESLIQFVITIIEAEASMPKKIFLSHKGVDKPVIREYFHVLRTIGFDPWLDEDAMVAGSPLERALLTGMKESCAAVFFVTPDYKDENYLASEVNYAIAQKREKAEKFSIITLVLMDANGNKGVVPELLRQYVWKEPSSSLQGLNEILRALPIETKHVDWKI